MELAQYKRAVLKTLDVKPAKEGIRKIARKSATVNVAHTIVGLKTATGEFLEAMEPYLLGKQLNDSIRKDAAVKLGDVTYYLTALAKIVRVKMPSTRRKTPLKGKTLTKAILELDQTASKLLDEYKVSFIGDDINLEKVRELLTPVPLLVYGISYQLFNEPIAALMDKSFEGFAGNYPQGYFDLPKREKAEAATEPATEASNPASKPKAKAAKKQPKQPATVH